MKHLFIPYELAVIAKEKGFNEKCFGMYWNRYGHGFILETMLFCEQQMMGEVYQAPLYQQIVDWIRDVHQLNIFIVPQGDTISWSLCNINHIDKIDRYDRIEWAIREKYSGVKFKTYYEALDVAIKESFNLIK